MSYYIEQNKFLYSVSYTQEAGRGREGRGREERKGEGKRGEPPHLAMTSRFSWLRWVDPISL